jgi:hypothetical protein
MMPGHTPLHAALPPKRNAIAPLAANPGIEQL